VSFPVLPEAKYKIVITTMKFGFAGARIVAKKISPPRGAGGIPHFPVGVICREQFTVPHAKGECP
jgi:hypothetical protein